MIRPAPLAIALLLARLPAAWSQAGPPAVVIATTPTVPLRGTVAWLRVADDSTRPAPDRLRGVEGECAGEPLHFEPLGGGAFRALFGVPVEGGDSLPVRLILQREGGEDTTTVALVVTVGGYPRERLRVAPRMARPDSATQARIAGEVARAREVSHRSHQTDRLWSGSFRVPRPTRITSQYGAAREYNGEITSRHMGTDFAGKVGAPVRAPARAVVALVADFYLAGRAVYLDHGGGLVTGYFHLSRSAIAEGDTVRVGQVIGAVGRSGRVTGPHLHWIARYGAITVDPMSLVSASASPPGQAELP